MSVWDGGVADDCVGVKADSHLYPWRKNAAVPYRDRDFLNMTKLDVVVIFL